MPRLLCALTILLLGRPDAALAEGLPAPKEHPVKAELIAEHASIQPGGTTRVGVHFDIEDGWHIYADKPGDAGLPTTIVWTGSEGASFGPLHYPTPQEFLDPGDIRTFGYTGAVVLFSQLTQTPPANEGTTVRITAKVKWLACKEVCLPGSASLDLSLPASNTPPVLSTHAEFFDHAS